MDEGHVSLSFGRASLQVRRVPAVLNQYIKPSLCSSLCRMNSMKMNSMIFL